MNLKIKTKDHGQTVKTFSFIKRITFLLIISQQDKDVGITINQNRPELKFKAVGILDDNARGDLSDEMADLCAKLPIHVVVKVDRAPTDQASAVALVQRRCNSRHITSQYMKDH